MTDYGFKIGMNVNELKNLLSKTNVTEETKKLIFDFCEKDLDKKISDDIELHILNTWASGQTKVEMPNIKKDSKLSREVHLFTSLFGIDNVEKFSNNINGGNCVSISTQKYKFGGKLGDEIYSVLGDSNNDGYADFYCSSKYSDGKWTDIPDREL